MGKQKRKRAGLFLKPNIFCHYNCGRLAYYIFDNGKACCESNIGRCPTIRRKRSTSLVESKKRKKRIGIVLDSNTICDYGCEQQAYYFFGNGKVCCENHSEKCLGQKRTGSDHHSFGKPGWNRGLTKEDHPGIAVHSKEMKGRKQSDEHKRKKGFRPGHEPSEETKEKQSTSAKRRANTDEYKVRFTEIMTSPEVLAKQTFSSRSEIRKKSYERNPDLAKNHSDTMKRKYAEGEIKPWSEGLTKETSESLARASEKKKGQKSWIKGLTKDDPRVASLADKVRKDRVMVNCNWCGKELKRLPKRINKTNFCDSKCHAEWLSENQKEEKNPVWIPRMEIRCDWCEKKMKRLPKRINKTNFCNKNCQDSYHSKRMKDDPDTAKRAAEAVLADKVYKEGIFYSVKSERELYYQSSYELTAFEILEQLSKVKEYSRVSFGISYVFKGEKHYTIPDILVTYTDGTRELIEVKSEWELHKRKTNIKFWAMNDYAANQGWDFNVWTEKELGLN